jgi:hypothetical protein
MSISSENTEVFADEESNLSKVVAVSSKLYDSVAEGADPLARDTIRAIEVAKKFIIERGRILYGGTAIDHAMRLKGDKLYDDSAVPDLDFYSPENIKDAYDLAEIFLGMGYKEARAIVGIHPTIMKVDIGGNHWICDIAYFTPQLYDRLPTLTYKGMRSVGMDYQRLDVHSSLAFPYDNPPTEVIFDRWEKDIRRFNIFDNYYPWLPMVTLKEHCAEYKTALAAVERSQVSAPIGLVYSGFAAFAAYCEALKGRPEMATLSKYGIDAGKFAIGPEGDTVVFSTIGRQIDIAHINPSRAARETGLQGMIERHEQLMNATPKHTVGTNAAGDKVVIESTKGRLLAIKVLTFGKYKVKVVCVQYLLRHFIARYFASPDGDVMRKIYYQYYATLLAMVKASDAPELGLSVEVYGNLNMNAVSKKKLNAIAADIDSSVHVYKQPQNYTPAKAVANNRGRPPIAIEDYYFYQENGAVTKRQL